VTNVRDILDDIDYLVPLISYLGSNPYWWARTAPSLAQELSLDPLRVQQLFERYPMIFRKSRYIEESKADSYALQWRYAQRSTGDLEQPTEVSHFPVLQESQVISLIDFLVRISNVETVFRSSRRTGYVSVGSAIVAAIAAICAAFLSHISASCH
jgi:hypothetical protein